MKFNLATLALTFVAFTASAQSPDLSDVEDGIVQVFDQENCPNTVVNGDEVINNIYAVKPNACPVGQNATCISPPNVVKSIFIPQLGLKNKVFCKLWEDDICTQDPLGTRVVIAIGCTGTSDTTVRSMTCYRDTVTCNH